LGFGSPKSLSDKNIKALDTLRPTLFPKA